MKPSSAAAAAAGDNVVALKPPKKVRLGRGDTEFLPAALEIIETPASPVGRAIAGTIIAFAAIAVAWSCFGEVDIIATAQGRIIPTGKSKVIQPFETGVVRSIPVHDGSVVHVGDVLVEMDPTEDVSDETRSRFGLAEDHLDIVRLKALLQGDVASFDLPEEAEARLIQMARRQMEAQAAEETAKLNALDRQIAQKEAEGRETRAAIAKVEAGLPLLAEQRDIRAAYLQREWGNRLTYLQTQQQLVEAQHELEVQKEKWDETVQALASLQQQRVQAQAEYRKSLLIDLAKAEVPAKEHEQELAKAAQKRALRTLRSPVEGTVQQLAVHMATIADQIVDTLATAGVKRIWGVVGVSLNGFTDALRRHGGITWMRVSNKEAGAFAAAGEAAVSGKLAVCADSCGLGQPAPDQRHLRRPPLAGAGGRDRRPDPLARDRFRLRGVARDAAVRRRLPGRLLQAPVHALGGKEPVEPDNPYDVGMTGLIGFSSGYHALRECDTLLMQGTDFPYPQFYPEHARVAQVDVRPGVIGRRTAVELEVIGDVRSTFRALLPRLNACDNGALHLDGRDWDRVAIEPFRLNAVDRGAALRRSFEYSLAGAAKIVSQKKWIDPWWRRERSHVLVQRHIDRGDRHRKCVAQNA